MKEATTAEIFEAKHDFIMSTSTCGPCVRLKSLYADDDDKWFYTMDQTLDTNAIQNELYSKLSVLPRMVPALYKYDPETDMWDNWGNPTADEPKKLTPAFTQFKEGLDLTSGMLNWKHFKDKLNDRQRYVVISESKNGVNVETVMTKQIAKMTDKIQAIYLI
jgi:hypothetical protein